MSADAVHEPELPFAVQLKVDEVCRRFEAAWQESDCPRIEDHLGQTDRAARRLLLAELMRLDIEYRSKAGEVIGASDYVDRFPRDTNVVDSVFREIGQHVDTSQPRSNTLASGRIQVEAPELSGAFGRYRILDVLGRGAMGAVYLAEDTELDRKAAIKVPRFGEGADPSLLGRFQREAKAAARLRHPNICPVYDVGSHDGTNYISMAYVEGGLLSDRIRSTEPFSVGEAVRLAQGLADALGHAHREGVIHRDLKPGNVMIDERGEPIVMDFGLACRTEIPDAERSTQHGDILGTPAYMAPEQARGQRDEIGPASDVYSLGVILYEMLTGRLPYSGNVTAVLSQILDPQVQPEPPSQIQPDVSADLEGVCAKAMAKDVAQRYQSMDELAVDLQRIADGRPPATDEATLLATGGRRRQSSNDATLPGTAGAPPTRPARSSRRNRIIAALAAVGLVAAVVVLTIKTRKGEIRIELDDRYKDENVKIAIDGDSYTIEGLGKPIRLTPGDHELTITRGDTTVQTRSFTVTRGGNAALKITYVEATQPGGPDRDGPVVKPVDPGPPPPNLLASSGYDGRVVLYDLDQKAVHKVLKGHDGPVERVRFFPDGRRLATCGRDGTVRIWNAADGRQVKSLAGVAVAVKSLAVSADGKLLLAASRTGLINATGEKQAPKSQPAVLVVWNTSDWSVRRRIEDPQIAVASLAISPDSEMIAVGTADGRIRFYETSTGKRLGRDTQHRKPQPADAADRGARQHLPINAIAFARRGRELVTASAAGDGTARIFGAAAGDNGLLTGHAGTLTSLACFSDADLLVTAGIDGVAIVWEVDSGRKLGELKGHNGGIWSVDVSADGHVIATGGMDGTVRLWNAFSGKPISSDARHPGWVSSVAFSPQARIEVVRNPFGLQDVPSPFGAQTKRLLTLEDDLQGGAKDKNASKWTPEPIARKEASIEGRWYSRWQGGRKDDGGWAVGRATIRAFGNHVFMHFQDDVGEYLIETRRVGNRLIGKYVNVLPEHRDRDQFPWYGVIVDNERIDGMWREVGADGPTSNWGRWDFRRRLVKPVDGKPAKQKPVAFTDRTAAEWVLGIGGTVDVVVDGKTTEVRDLADLPSAEFQLAEVDLSGKALVSDASLARLNGRPLLSRLKLRDTPITDEGIASLTELPALEFLDIRNLDLTGDGVAGLSRFKALREIVAGGTGFTDASLAALVSLSELSRLTLYGSTVNDQSLERLRGRDGLTRLTLYRTSVTDAALKHLATLPALTDVWLMYNAGITPRGVSGLQSLPKLRWLDLSTENFDAADFALLAGFKGVDHLDLRNVTVTDAFIEDLKRMPSLKKVHLFHSHASDEAVESLKKAFPDSQVQRSPTEPQT